MVSKSELLERIEALEESLDQVCEYVVMNVRGPSEEATSPMEMYAQKNIEQQAEEAEATEKAEQHNEGYEEILNAHRLVQDAKAEMNARMKLMDELTTKFMNGEATVNQIRTHLGLQQIAHPAYDMYVHTMEEGAVAFEDRISRDEAKCRRDERLKEMDPSYGEVMP